MIACWYESELISDPSLSSIGRPFDCVVITGGQLGVEIVVGSSPPRKADSKKDRVPEPGWGS